MLVVVSCMDSLTVRQGRDCAQGPLHGTGCTGAGAMARRWERVFSSFSQSMHTGANGSGVIRLDSVATTGGSSSCGTAASVA